MTKTITMGQQSAGQQSINSWSISSTLFLKLIFFFEINKKIQFHRFEAAIMDLLNHKNLVSLLQS